MKKRRIVIIAAAVLLLLVLFVPYRTDILEDGGSKVYSAVMYKYIQWKGVLTDEYGQPAGGIGTIRTSIHWFPNNRKPIDELRKKAFDSSGQ